MRAFNILAIIVCLFVLWYGANLINEIQELVQQTYFSYGRHVYRKLEADIANLGFNGSFVMLLIGFFFLALYIVNINKIKRTTAKVMSILGIIITTIFLIINVIFIGSMDSEFFPVAFFSWWLFGILCLAFTIVLLVQAVRDHVGERRPVFANSGNDVLDDFTELDDLE